MAMESIVAEIERFVESEAPEIICIRGSWGVGKTYAWRKILKKSEVENRIGLSKYSYVSLFGRNSLADLRSSIVENTIDTRDVEAKPSPTSLENATSLTRKIFQRTGSLMSLASPTAGYAQLAQRVLYLLVKNTIVCLDDLERAGTGLHMKDVLGLASQLKDEKDCKVVILLNDEKLDQDAKNVFAEQLEKVTDVVIDFKTSPEEAVDIALDTTTVFYDGLRANCVKLKLDNIRVIKKAERFCTRLLPLLAGFDQRLLTQAVHTGTIACYAKFQPDKAPSLASIRKFNLWDAMARTVNGEKREVDQHFVIMQEYGLTSIDGFDEQILDGVDRGFFDEPQLLSEATQLDSDHATADMKADYHKIWEIYRSSFARNEAELATLFIQAVRRNVAVMDPSNLQAVIRVLRELDYEEEASNLIRFFMESKTNEIPEYWDVARYNHTGRIKDNEIALAMAQKLKSKTEQIDPVVRLKAIGETGGWDYEDEIAILELSTNAIAAIMLKSEPNDLGPIVDAYNKFLSIGNPSVNLAEICRRARAALKVVAEDSKLNAMRVKSLFHDVDLEV